LKASRLQQPFKAKISKDVYIKKFGPTVGDRVRLLGIRIKNKIFISICFLDSFRRYKSYYTH
jgi:hypothetical protein